MSRMNAEIALDYLSPPPDAFWRWDEDGQVVAWRETGQTIVFRTELEAVLRELSDGPLPPIEAILVFLAACLPTWSSGRAGPLLRAGLLSPGGPLADWDTLFRAYGHHSFDPSLVRDRDKHSDPLALHLERVLAGLEELNELPEEQRTGVANKARLARELLEPVRVREQSETTSAVMDMLRGGIPARALVVHSADRADSLPLRLGAADTIVALYQALCVYPVTSERVRMLSRTGVEDVPRPAPVDLPPGRAVARLLRELRDDDDLGGLARIAGDLLAVVHLPRSVSDPEQLPIGGLSDITNRGSLDRLLPGELAHDDLTLSVRIALNEALYYRREAPPRSPVIRRRILVDSGIRMWGVPRVYAVAVALAMAATAPDTVDVHAARATRLHAVKADLFTREGLLDLLEGLDLQTCPDKALLRFVEDDPAAEDADDLVVVTHADAAEDAGFLTALAAVDRPVYVAAVDGDGGYALWRHGGRGRRLLREARLDLRDLLADRSARRVEIIDDRAEADASLPAIFRVRPFPLRVPHHVKWANTAWRQGVGLLSVTKDRRLTLWDSPAYGPIQAADGLGGGAVLWVDFLDDRTAALVQRSRVDVLLVLADLEAGSLSTRRIEAPDRLQGAILLGDRLVLVGRRQLSVLDAWTGQHFCNSGLSEGVAWTGRGRLFTRGPQWMALHWAGGAVRFEDLEIPDRSSTLLRAVFEREGTDGPWALWGDGTIESLATGKAGRVTDHPLASFIVQGISADGHRLVLHRPGTRDGQRPLAVDLQAEKTRNVYDELDAQRFLAAPENATSASGRSIWQKTSKFQTAWVDCSGDCPMLVFAQDRRTFGLVAAGPKISVGRVAPRKPPDPHGPRAFTPFHGGHKAGCQLTVARWPDGGKVWLDSRGLVHLQSAEPNAPELTFVLAVDAQSAGWSSDGLCCGEQHFIGDRPRGRIEDLSERLAKFIRGLE